MTAVRLAGSGLAEFHGLRRDEVIKQLCLAFGVLAVSACGGGGGGGGATPTSQDAVFDLTGMQSTEQGTIYSTALTGSDSEGNTYTGTLSLANRAKVMLGGILVTPTDALISLTSNTGYSVTVTSTSNVDASGNLISTVVQTSGQECVPVSPDRMPTTAKIGDFGILSTMVCNDATTTERNWRAEDAGNGNLNIVSSSVVKDQFNAAVSNTDITVTINTAGTVLAFKAVSNLPESGYMITYQSL